MLENITDLEKDLLRFYSFAYASNGFPGGSPSMVASLLNRKYLALSSTGTLITTNAGDDAVDRYFKLEKIKSLSHLELMSYSLLVGSGNAVYAVTDKDIPIHAKLVSLGLAEKTSLGSNTFAVTSAGVTLFWGYYASLRDQPNK